MKVCLSKGWKELEMCPIRIGNIGRMCSGKGQLELIEAFPLIPDTRLAFVGA